MFWRGWFALLRDRDADSRDGGVWDVMTSRKLFFHERSGGELVLVLFVPEITQINQNLMGRGDIGPGLNHVPSARLPRRQPGDWNVCRYLVLQPCMDKRAAGIHLISTVADD